MAIYNNKHCVFEMVGVENSSVVWNPYTNLDNDNAQNDWNISDMRNTTLPTHLLLLSNDLQSIITNTTIQTATNGINGTLVSTSDKLFLAAEKEMRAYPSIARTEENNTLITWSYWTTHTTNSDRVKLRPNNTASSYWLRSPVSNKNDNVLMVGSNGVFNNTADGGGTQRISLCYAL